MQPSLLRGIDLEKPVPRRFDLGMVDFVESTAFEKEKENRCLSLSLKKKSRANAPPTKRPCLQSSENQAPERFDFMKDDAYSEMSVQFVPKNTKKNNDWAFKNFQAWLETRNRAYPDAQCPVVCVFLLSLAVPQIVLSMSMWLDKHLNWITESLLLCTVFFGSCA